MLYNILTTLVVCTLICMIDAIISSTLNKKELERKCMYRVIFKLLKSLKAVLSSEWSVGIKRYRYSAHFTYSIVFSCCISYRRCGNNMKIYLVLGRINQIVRKYIRRIKQISLDLLIYIISPLAYYVISEADLSPGVGLAMTLVVAILCFVLIKIKKD